MDSLRIVFAFVLLAVGCTSETSGVVELELSGSLDDLGTAGVNDLDPSSMRGLLQLLMDVSEDDEVSGVLLHLGHVGGGPARLEEVRSALARLQDSGRTVHCQLEDASNFSLWLAAGSCEHIALSPGGAVELTGLASESYYLRELLDSVGVEFDVLQMGTHKGALEFLTREEMSPESRETMDDLLDDYMEILVSGIAAGRELEPAQVRDIIDEGPFHAEHAAEAGLVDALEYRDQARERLEKAMPNEARLLKQYTEDWAKSRTPSPLAVLAGEGGAPPVVGERVAVLYLSGTIVGGSGSGMMSDQITLPPVRSALKAIREDEDIRAVVVRIDSPGGSALVSDEIWHELIELREERPIVASMGSVAASGGYYIAAAATEILAQPGTITGSIGVIGGKPVLTDLLEDLGARPELITRGRNSGLASLSRPFSLSQRESLERLMQAVYDRFVHVVAQSRVMDEEHVRSLATGRAWTGTRALELGLVDQLGGLHDAIVLARELGGLAEDAPVEPFPKPLSLIEQLERAMQPPSPLGAAQLLTVEGSAAREVSERALTAAMLFQEERVLALWPVYVNIQ